MRCLGETKGYRLPEKVLDEIFLDAQEMMNELGIEPKYLYASVKGYLWRDPNSYSISFPHDAWADVIVKKQAKGRIIGIISIIESEYKPSFKTIIERAFLRALEKASSNEAEMIKYFAMMNDIPLTKRETSRRIKVMVSVGTEMKEYVIEGNEFVVGRNKTSEELEIRAKRKIIGLGIYDYTVSREHVLVSVDESGDIIIEDLNSKNGTLSRDKNQGPCHERR